MRVETSFGSVEGQQRGGHAAFLGIPYAKPPVGALRFQPPQAPEAWAGARSALAYSPIAMQGLQFVPGELADGPQSEDCLYLNVFTRVPGARKRPVLVWIHGGAFVVGAASLPVYDGGPLCELGDAVVVTLNYRLGSLGFLWLGDDAERLGITPNLGVLDQIAALRWVHDNISAFGGDPDNVTLFGESAGASSVCALLLAPAARGLFQRAISQSSALGLQLPSLELAARSAQQLLDKLGLGRERLESRSPRHSARSKPAAAASCCSFPCSTQAACPSTLTTPSPRPSGPSSRC
jgi:para-nitrobenzyl esterase